MKSNLHVRPIQRDNLHEQAAVVNLVNRCYRSRENWTNEADIVSGLRVTADSLRNDLHNLEMFIIEDQTNGAPVGCIKTGLVTETVMGPLNNPAGYLGTFAIAPEIQSQGHGRELLQVAENYCRSKGAKRMAMDVLDVRKELIQWYERIGYKRTGESLDAAKFMDNKGEKLLVPCSFILMTREL